MDWFLCDNGLRHERVNVFYKKQSISVVLVYDASIVIFFNPLVPGGSKKVAYT